MRNEQIKVSAEIGMEAWTGGPKRIDPVIQNRPNTLAPLDREQDMAMREVSDALLVNEPIATTTSENTEIIFERGNK